MIAVFVLMLLGLLWVVSLGHVETTDPMADASTGISVSGVARKFAFSQGQWAAIGYWIFGSLWLIELVRSLGQFAISSAVVEYTLAGTKTCLPLARGYVKGLVFHLGTLAIAALLVDILAFLAIFLSFVRRQTSGEDGGNNVVLGCCFACCGCCLACIEQIVRFANQMIYVEVAIQGTGYFTSAWKVWRMAGSNPVTAATLVGATRIVHTLGIVVLGGGGTILSYQLLTNDDDLMAGPASILHTSNVIGTTVASGFICIGVAMTFMSVFDMTADTIAYIEIWKGVDDHDEARAPSWLMFGEEYAGLPSQGSD